MEKRDKAAQGWVKCGGFRGVPTMSEWPPVTAFIRGSRGPKQGSHSKSFCMYIHIYRIKIDRYFLECILLDKDRVR